jgi:hypothetical protein
MRRQMLGFLPLLLVGCGGAAGGHVTEVGKTVYTSAVTQLVLEDHGGGYGPPPPADAECTPYSARYTVTVAGRQLAWDRCAFQGEGASPSYKPDTGTRTLGADEWTALEHELRKLVVDDGKSCGADKPVVDLVVSTSDGDLKYGDGFYGCDQASADKPLIVSNGLSAAETALAALAKK